MNQRIKFIEQIDIEAFILKIHFVDGTAQTIDFSLAIYKLRGENAKYRDYQLFCDHKVKDGSLVWGKDEEMLFSNWDLYENRVSRI